ncbi:acyl carrier protein [Amycolatopsis thailandensis]|uniref:acyl carrier protein n=1 Tax=Amycolatopsis thailandensis TaxID=589330 RepID=UPI003633B6D8
MSHAIDPQTPGTRPADLARRSLTGFLEASTKTTVDPAQDLFSAGLISSLFALQLVVHLEREFGVTVAGDDLRLDNFRSVDAMVALLVRLGGARDD